MVNEQANEQRKWIDARFSLQDPLAGEFVYRSGHIKGAVHWDLEKDLSDMQTSGGRHPLPDHDALTELYQRSGIELDDEIIIYDNGGEPFAARAWWVLQYGGFTNVHISLEGYEGLVETGEAFETEIPVFERSSVRPQWNESILALKEDVRQLVDEKSEEVLLDARAGERYRGEHEPLDPIAGHIPSAQNFDWAQLVKEGMFEIAGEGICQLERMVKKDQSVTVYCGSGVTAAPLYAMLKEKGYSHVRLYAGSYSDWISEGDLPVETSTNEQDGAL